MYQYKRKRQSTKGNYYYHYYITFINTNTNTNSVAEAINVFKKILLFPLKFVNDLWSGAVNFLRRK